MRSRCARAMTPGVLPCIVGTAPPCVLASLSILNDDFGIYQGYRRYADIVASHALNPQDASIFAT
ncbi:conserved protein of unknown function [Burkholderia multivorans]